MAEVDEWTDGQIRDKFEELGCSTPPITATTRKIILKRLKTLMSNGGNPVTKPHEEEPQDDDDDEPDVLPLPPTRIPRRLGRSALARAALDQSNNQSMNGNNFDSISPILNGDTGFDKARSRSPGRRSLGRADQPPAPRSQPEPSPTRLPKPETRTRSPGRASLGRASDFVTPTPDFSNEENERPARKVTPGRRVDTEDRYPDLRKSAERIVQEARESVARGEAFANQAFRSRLFDSASPATFTSDYMKKLSSSVSESCYTGNDDEVMSDDDGVVTSPVRVVRGNRSSGYEVRSGKTESVFPVTLFFVLLVPFTILIGIGVLFFNSPQTDITQQKLIHPICEDSTMPYEDCIEETDLVHILTLYKAFNNGLTEVRLGAPCTTSDSQPVFIDNDSIKEMIVSKDNRISVWVAEKKLKELKILLGANPHLNIRCETDGISLIKGPDSFICNLWSTMVQLAELIVKIGVTIIVAVLSWLGIQWYLTKQQKRKDDVAFAVDKVVDLTKTRKFLAVDQMERELALGGFPNDIITEAFNTASRDSRLTLDSRNNITGLRWVNGTSTGSLFPNNHPEGDRFSSCIVPPTSCLKIRGMFAPAKKITNDSDIRQLVDTILEKSTGNRIVHIVVDRKSPDGIVYLRCMTKSDAGGVFKNLNSSFFEGQPISIKFVRESRYDEKFPDSAKCTRPLRPPQH